MPEPTSQTEECHLLNLPAELQLSIYELVLIQPDPYLLNHACNSSLYHKDWYEERQKWASGRRRPPAQPSLTQTCKSIRKMTLPIFYGDNVFRAGYCRSAGKISLAIRWLEQIGAENRAMLRHLYFFDRSTSQDARTPSALRALILAVEQCGFFDEKAGARIDPCSSDYCCAHLVTFGNAQRKEEEVPLALRDAERYLGADGEI